MDAPTAEFPILKNKSMVPRKYQSEIFSSLVQKGSTLVVLPTGLGKTLIAFMAISHFLPKGKCLFLAPTKPLALQHYKKILEDIDVPEADVAMVSGEIKPADRAALWQRKIVVSTPQTIRNDIAAGRATFDYALCVFDEAHRTVGNYAYTYLARLATQHGCVVLAMTASPGSDMKKIGPIVEVLGTKNVQIRTEDDPSVLPYVQDTQINYVHVELGSELGAVKNELERIVVQYCDTLAKMGFPGKFRSKTALLEMRGRIMKSDSHMKYSAISYFTTVFNLCHAQELFETQGVGTYLQYMEKLKTRNTSKGVQRILSDSRIKAISEKLQNAAEHPKLAKLAQLLASLKGEKTIVFVQYRNQISLVVQTLKQSGFRAERFVGKKDGVTQSTQRATLESFRAGEFDVLVASSIGEEGLDVPVVDNVIFFEPVGSEIRTIQRRGRAGRTKAGKIFILITKGTRDEGYFWASKRRESRMQQIVRRMQTASQQPQPKSNLVMHEKQALKEPDDSSNPKSQPSALQAQGAANVLKPKKPKKQSRLSDYA